MDITINIADQEAIIINISEQEPINITIDDVTVVGGDTEGVAGDRNVFIQETDPALAVPYVWFQTDGSGNLVTLWINT